MWFLWWQYCLNCEVNGTLYNALCLIPNSGLSLSVEIISMQTLKWIHITLQCVVHDASFPMFYLKNGAVLKFNYHTEFANFQTPIGHYSAFKNRGHDQQYIGECNVPRVLYHTNIYLQHMHNVKEHTFEDVLLRKPELDVPVYHEYSMGKKSNHNVRLLLHVYFSSLLWEMIVSTISDIQIEYSLLWRHNERDGVSNHQPQPSF